MALTRPISRATDITIHGFQTGASETAQKSCPHFQITALLCLSLVVLCHPLILQAGPPLLSCKALAQLFLSSLRFNPFLLGLLTKVLSVRDLELSLRWRLDSSAILHGLGLLAATVRVDCVLIDGAGVGD